MNFPEVAALVPMRHHSERVPKKNYRNFANNPLYHRIIETLITCSNICKIVIDTDSSVITEDAADHYPEVVVLARPEHLRAGDTPMNDVLIHTTSQVDADFYLQTHSTNPLLSSGTIEAAIESFLGNYPQHDSLFSVSMIQKRLWDQRTKPINHNPAILLRTQDLPPIFEENSCLYIFNRETLVKQKNRIGLRPLMFQIDRNEAWDIDDELDFAVCEFLYLSRQASHG